MDYIATWIYCDKAGEESGFPQAGGASSSSFNHQAIYWRCVYAFYRFAIKYNPKCSLLLFTNRVEDDLVIDGHYIQKELKALGVQIRGVEFKSKMPKGYYDRFGNQLYEFDILKDFLTLASREDVLLLLDSDCIITQDLSTAFAKARELKALTVEDEYRFKSGTDYDINGITLDDMAALFTELNPDKGCDRAHYCCGEFFCATYDFITDIFKDFDRVHEAMKQKFIATGNKDTVKFNEEAHFFSYFYWLYDIPLDTGDDYIKRMWTTFHYNVIQKGDENYPIWHVLSGKYLYPSLLHNIDKKLNWSDDRLIRYLKRMFLYPSKIRYLLFKAGAAK